MAHDVYTSSDKWCPTLNAYGLYCLYDIYVEYIGDTNQALSKSIISYIVQGCRISNKPSSSRFTIGFVVSYNLQ